MMCTVVLFTLLAYCALQEKLTPSLAQPECRSMPVTLSLTPQYVPTAVPDAVPTLAHVVEVLKVDGLWFSHWMKRSCLNRPLR